MRKKLPVPGFPVMSGTQSSPHVGKKIASWPAPRSRERLHATESASDRELLQRQIDATDRAIDRLVYELYRLTQQEIAIVEGE